MESEISPGQTDAFRGGFFFKDNSWGRYVHLNLLKSHTRVSQCMKIFNFSHCQKFKKKSLVYRDWGRQLFSFTCWDKENVFHLFTSCAAAWSRVGLECSGCFLGTFSFWVKIQKIKIFQNIKNFQKNKKNQKISNFQKIFKFQKVSKILQTLYRT